MFSHSFIFITIILIFISYISYKFNKIYETNIINIVLSKIEYIPKYYKIIRQKNRIYIKCHNYITGCGVDVKYKNIKLYTKSSNQTDFIYTYKTLDNYDSDKCITIAIYDIIIDLTNKNYKIITSYLPLINCKYDLDNLYNKLIDKLNNKSYYIQINNLYDTNLNFINDEEWNFEPIRRNTYIYNNPLKINDNCFKLRNPIKLNNESINIIIKNDYNNDNIIINSMFSFIDNQNSLGISNTIDTKPHIYNNNGTIRINKITGYFI